MNIQQLKCFVEVSRTLNFTKAGQNLFISQTAVTNHIKNLEEILGFALFERTKKNVTLTQKGHIFLKSALKLLEAGQECYQTIQYLNHENVGRLKIGYLKGIEHCLMIDIIQNFYQSYPQIDIQLYRESRNQLEDMLRNHEVDCIFTASIGQYNQHFSEEMSSCFIHSYPFVVVLNKNHPLAYKEKVDYFEIKNQTHVIMDSSDPHFISHDLDEILMNIAIHDDTAILADFIKDYYAYQKYLCFLPMKDFHQSFDIHIVWHQDHKNKALYSFLENIEQKKNEL